MIDSVMSLKLSTFQSWKKANKNLKSSAISEHAKSKMHARALQLEEEEQARAENRKIRVTAPPSSENSPITAAVGNMGRLGKEERSSIQRLFDIAYLIASKGRPYCDFTDIIELEKLHGVKFFSNSVYENVMGCKIFIHFAAKDLFEKKVKDKIKRANFITVLADRATDAVLIEKEVMYILFVDPDEFKPSLEFLWLKSVASQDAQGIISAIVDAFQDCDISEKLRGEKLNYKSVAKEISIFRELSIFKCFYSLLKIYNYRNIVHFLKRMLQVVDNAMFWQHILLYFENDPLSPSF